MKSKKLYLRSVEVMLGLTKIDDIVDFDIRGIIRGCVEQMEIEMKETSKMMKECPYELKLAMMKFYENASNLAEAEHGPYFTSNQFQESVLKMLNGNPLNMMAMINKNNVTKN
jgi:hypothetical protein